MIKPEPDDAGDGLERRHRQWAATGEPVMERHAVHARLASRLRDALGPDERGELGAEVVLGVGHSTRRVRCPGSRRLLLVLG